MAFLLWRWMLGVGSRMRGICCHSDIVYMTRLNESRVPYLECYLGKTFFNDNMNHNQSSVVMVCGPLELQLDFDTNSPVNASRQPYSSFVFV